ncbi:MAG: hypothetical protein ACXADD_18155 [Candidatus Thorarchaeota archaeon]
MKNLKGLIPTFVGVFIVFLGIAFVWWSYPSVEWIMRHTAEELLALRDSIMPMLYIAGIIGLPINLYGLYILFFTEE